MLSLVGLSGTLVANSQEQIDSGPTPYQNVDLYKYGLPAGFFRANTDTKCANKIIGYRFVVWLNDESVAVGFNISPNCRSSHNRKVEGLARILVFNVSGVLKAKRDVPYLADGNGEIVAQGEADPGPGGTLLFRIESVNLDPEGKNESKSGVLLLDQDLKDVVRLDRFMEQTTFVNHDLVFQEGFTVNGPRTYSVLEGAPPVETQRWIQDWPIGTMDRKFGEHAIAYMLCQQDLQSNVYSSTNVVYAGAKMRCAMNVKSKDQTVWSVPLKEEGSAAIVGLLADGSVAGQINVKGSSAGRLVIWKKDQTTEYLPWISDDYDGAIQNATPDMARYATFATKDSASCKNLNVLCSQNGRWSVFDRRIKSPIVNRPFAKNGRAALSPDGLRYASFESGEFRLYSLAKP